MTEYRYFKVHPDFNSGHIPANRELVGCRVGWPYDERFDIFRYPVNTTVHMSLMFSSHSTYDEARNGAYYEGK